MRGLLSKKIHISSDFILSVFLFILTFVIAGSFSLFGIDPRHDGIMLKPALDVTRGLMLFRDSFTLYGALTTLIQASALILFGKYLITLQLLTAAFYGGIAALQYLLYKRILPSSIALITVILWIFSAPYFFWTFHPWTSVYALFFQLVAAYLVIRWIETKHSFYIFLAGITAAGVFYSRLSVGVFTALGVMAFFVILALQKKLSVKQAGKHIAYFISGFIFIVILFSIWLGINNAFNDWWSQSFTLGSLYATQFHSVTDLLHLLWITFFPFSNPIFVTSPVELWVLLPVASIIVFVQYCFFRNKDAQKHVSTVLLLTLVALAAWTQYYPMIDYRHIYWGSTPMFGVLAVFWYELVRFILSIFKKNSVPLATIITIVGLCILFYPDISTRILAGKEKLSLPYETISQPVLLKGMRVTAREQQYILDFENSLIEYFSSHPEGIVVNLSEDGLYPALYDHMKYIPPLYVYWPQFMGSVFPNFLPRISAYIAQYHPLVVTSRTSILPSGYCPVKYLDSVYGAYLALPCGEKLSL